MSDVAVDAGGSPPAGELIELVTRPSGWDRVRLYAAAASAPHVRRRVDITALALCLLALAVVVPTARTTDGVEAALVEVVGSMPAVVAPVAGVPYDLLALWSLVMVALALVRRHWRLALSLLAAVPVAAALTLALDRALGLEGEARDLALGARQEGVPIQLVLELALAGIAARELSRPFRSFGRRLAVAAVLGAVLVPIATPYRILCGVLAAGVTVALMRLAFGSPRITVSPGDVRAGLRDLGLETAPVDRWPPGEALGLDGSRLSVLTLGRDDWDAQLMVSLWRVLWYRNSGSSLRLSPRRRLEHQALLLLLAEQRQVRVTPVAAVGMSRLGDAVLATRVDGEPLSTLGAAQVDDALLARVWKEMEALHEVGIAHGAPDPSAILVDGPDTVRLAAFERAEPITRIGQIHADRAQLLVTTALSVGPERAIDAALRALASEEDAAPPLVAHLQPAAFDTRLRRATALAGLSIDELRTATAAAAGIDVPELQKIWRVSWGALLRLVLVSAVAYLFLSQLADIGWSTIVDAVQAASLPILLVALLLGQLPRVAQAGSLQTASPSPVPLLRVTKLVFATCFINLAVPSTAARVATSIRFFQRSGTTTAGAVSAGALDSVSGFVAQIALLFGLLLLGLGTLGLDGESSFDLDPAAVTTIVLVIVGLLLAAVIAVVAVAPLRQRVLRVVDQLREALGVLRSPGAVVRLLGFNLLAELLFSLTIWTVLQAFGQHVDLADVVIINEAVALFAGLVPVPGGVGITEGALAAGFIAVGVPDAVAFSAALSYRLCTFYLPPLWGYAAFSSLRRDGFL